MILNKTHSNPSNETQYTRELECKQFTWMILSGDDLVSRKYIIYLFLKAKPLCVQWFALTCCGQSTLCCRFQGPACRRAWLCGRRIRMPPHRHSVQTNTRFERNPGTRLNGSIMTSWKSKPLSCYQSELSSVPMRSLLSRARIRTGFLTIVLINKHYQQGMR